MSYNPLNPNGQTTKSASQPVTLASDQNNSLETGGNLATVATAQGAGASGITQPTGGSGILGWLSGIYNALVTFVTVKISNGTNQADVSSGDKNGLYVSLASSTPAAYSLPGSQSAGAVLAIIDTLGYMGFTIQVTSLGTGATNVAIKTSNDNSTWVNLIVNPMQINTSGGTATISNTAAIYTASPGTRYIQLTLTGAQSAGTTTAAICLKAATSSSPTTAINAAIPAGPNLIGKTGIDQTTPGTTNGVQVNAALPAGTNTIGAMTPVTLATGGWTPYFANALKTNSGAATAVSGAAGKFAGATLMNTDSAPVYLQCYDATATVTVGTTTPTFVIPYPQSNGTAANGTADRLGLGDVGVNIANGLKVAATTTATGATASTNGLTGSIWYK